MITNPTNAISIPNMTANLSGLMENVVRPFTHVDSNFLKLYPELPDALSFWLTGTFPMLSGIIIVTSLMFILKRFPLTVRVRPRTDT